MTLVQPLSARRLSHDSRSQEQNDANANQAEAGPIRFQA
jgi:hypothetical protein